MDQKSALTARLTVLEKNRLVDRLLLAAIPAGVGVFLSFLLWHFLPGTFGIHIAVIAAVVRFGVARENSRAHRVARTVQASAEGVRVDDRMIPRSAIAEGWYQPKVDGESTVRLFDKSKRILFEAKVEDEDQARSILRALGLDASQKRTQFQIPSPLAQSQIRVFLACLAVGTFSAFVAPLLRTHAGPLPFFLPVALVGMIALLPRKLTVGVDGILQRWLLWKRFTPMSSIVEAHAEGEREIRLQLANGKEEVITVSTAKRYGGIYTERRNMILARIRESARAHRHVGPHADLASVVARGERTLDEWKKSLVALAKGEAGYREAAIREEDLWRVVEDPRASSDARAGAAMILRKGLDEEGKARVRVAAEATASPHLRIALERAADAGDDAFEALDDIEVATSPALRAGASEGR